MLSSFNIDSVRLVSTSFYILSENDTDSESEAVVALPIEVLSVSVIDSDNP